MSKLGRVGFTLIKFQTETIGASESQLEKLAASELKRKDQNNYFCIDSFQFISNLKKQRLKIKRSFK